MQTQNINYIQIVPFSNFQLWDVNRYKLKSSIISNFEIVKLNSIIKQVEDYEVLKPEKEYKLCGISSYGQGIFHREIKKGFEIQAKKLNIIKVGQFIYSRLGANNGSFAKVTKEFDNYYVSNEFPTFELNVNRINIDYLEIIFKSKKYWSIINNQLQGAAHKRFKEELFLNIEIPLPSIEEQNKIVAAYQEKIQLAEQQAKQANELEAEIERYLMEELGVEKIKKSNSGKGISMINFSDLHEWGAEKLLKGNKNILTSNLYPNQKLSSLVYVNPRTDLTKLNENDEMSFLPMECISDDYGEVKELRNGIKKNSSGYTKFKEGDLLWARITPCMQNGKSAIVQGLKNKVGYGSTEYHVLRKLNEDFDIEFAYHLLRTKLVRDDATNYFTGSAGQQRVPKSYLENLVIPVPPINKQIEISKKLNSIKSQIKELNNKSEQNKIEAIKEFENVIFS